LQRKEKRRTQNNLQQTEDGRNDTSKSKGSSVDADITSISLLGGASSASSWTRSSIAWLVLIAGALVLALDNIIGSLLRAECAAGGGDITRALDVERTTVVLEGWKSDACKVAKHVCSATNALKTWKADLGQPSVVLDLETSSDGLEQGHGDVAQFSIRVDGEGASNGRQVWCINGGKSVLIETERSGDICQRGNGNGWAVAEGQIRGALEVGEACSETVTVALQDHRLRDVADLERHILQQPIIGNIDAGDLLQIDAIKTLEEGVLNVQSFGLGDTGCEAQLVKIG